MLNNIWFIAAIWMGLALVGSLISIWTGISVALIEILVGVAAGNIALGFEGGTLQIGIAGGNIDAGQLHHVLQSTEWTNFLAMLGAGVLTFLAGAEIDPHSLKANWRASVLIGNSLLCDSVRRRLVRRAVRLWLVTASGANRWDCALHDIS